MCDQQVPRSVGETAVFSLLVEGGTRQLGRCLARFEASGHTLDDIANFLADLQLAQDRFEGLLVRPQARELCLALDAALATVSLENLERRRSYTYSKNPRALAETETVYDVAAAG
jgi:hypothetical protein